MITFDAALNGYQECVADLNAFGEIHAGIAYFSPADTMDWVVWLDVLRSSGSERTKWFDEPIKLNVGEVVSLRVAGSEANNQDVRACGVSKEVEFTSQEHPESRIAFEVSLNGTMLCVPSVKDDGHFYVAVRHRFSEAGWKRTSLSIAGRDAGASVAWLSEPLPLSLNDELIMRVVRVDKTTPPRYKLDSAQ